MNLVQAFIEEIFKGIEITEEQKKAFLGIYSIAFYKVLLEILIGLKGQDKAFAEKMNSFFDSSISSLNEEEKKIFDKVVEEQRGKVLGEILAVFKDNLSPELKQKIEANLARLTQGK